MPQPFPSNGSQVRLTSQPSSSLSLSTTDRFLLRPAAAPALGLLAAGDACAQKFHHAGARFCYRDAKLAALVQCSFYSQGRGAVGHKIASSSAQASLTMGHECSQPRAGYELWVRAQHLGALARDFARRRGWLALGAGCGGRAISRLALLLSRRLASSAFGSALLACGHAMRSVENAKHVWFAELQDAFLHIASVRLSQPALKRPSLHRNRHRPQDS